MATPELPHEAPTHFRDSRGNMIVDPEHHPEAFSQGYAAAHDAITRQTSHANPYTPNTGHHEAWMAGHAERVKREEQDERPWSEAKDALETARLRLQAIRDHVNAFEQYAKMGDATWARNRVVMAAAELNCIADDLKEHVDPGIDEDDLQPEDVREAAKLAAQAEADTKPYVAALRITIPVRAKNEEDAAQLAADLITFDDSIVSEAEFMDMDAFPA